LLLGVAHASGTLGASTSNANAAFAANYHVTAIDNGVNNHQNNLHLSAGVVLRFGKS
jgi:hypothetical protein